MGNGGMLFPLQLKPGISSQSGPFEATVSRLLSLIIRLILTRYQGHCDVCLSFT